MKDNQKTKAQLLEEVADLRRQVQKQEAIQKAGQAGEDNYLTILDNIEDGYYEVDLSGKYTFVNPSYSKFHGRTPEEIIGQSYRNFLSIPESAEKIFSIFNEIFRTGIPAKIYDYQIIHTDGAIRDLEGSASLIFDPEGKPVGFRGISRDTTDRKAMELEQGRYRDFIENMDDVCVETDLEGKVIFSNNVLPRITGYTPEEFEQLKREDRYATPEEARRTLQIYTDMYRQGKQGERFYANHRTKEGKILTLELSTSLVRDAEGKPVGFRGIGRDVTERKKMEAEQARYRDFFENIEDGCWETDLSGNVNFTNKAAARTMGYTREEFLSLKNRPYSTPEGGKEALETFVKIYQTGNPMTIFDHEIKRKDGEIIHLEMLVSLIRDANGKPIGFRGVSRDITERKKLEIEQERYRDFVENITDGCIESDLAGNAIFVNDAACRMFGYPREELIGMNNRNRVTPETAKKIFEAFNEIYRTGIPATIFDYQTIQKNGKIRDLEVSGSLMRDQAGKPIGFRGVLRDITERKKMEAEQERYRDFVENINDGCWEVDLAGNMIFANDAHLRIYGYPREEFIGMNNRAYTSPETAKRIYEMFNQIYRTGQPAKMFDYEIFRKDGEIRLVEVSAALIRDQVGKPMGFRGVARDISERKKMEAEQERSFDFVKNINDGCWEVDLAGNMTFFNEAACRMFGYPREEFLGMNNRAYTSPETAKKIYKMFNEIYQTGSPGQIFYYEVIGKEGKVNILEMSASLIRDQAGKPVGFRGVSRDISELKKMEAEQERSRDFVENIADGCWELDLAGNITFINEAACRMIGYPREELLGMNNRAYTSPETAKEMFKVFSEIYRTGLPAKISSYPVVRKDGNTIFLELSASLSRDEAGNRVGFRGITRDITERKKMEVETARLSEQLNQARKLEAVGTLAGGVAHDFNNLLMGIQGYTSLMLLDTDPSHPFYEKFKAIEAQVRSAADLTKQLLGYARGGRYEVKPTNLNELIGKTASLFSRTKKGVRIHETLAKDLWKVEADQGQMEQVLLNLFMNAWQAMPGGGTIYLQTENVLLDESYVQPYGKAPGPFVKISVTDTGVGMDRETTGRIFEPFFTTKEMGRGTGLGLASTYGIISGHGGIITVYSEKGYGTTFNIYLPSSKKELIQEIRSARETLKGQETLLLVDDEKIIREVTGAMITHLGYQLLIAHNGEEAVEIYRANPGRIDLVIMDMIMPGIGGGEAFDLIKSINPQVKIILSSGFSLNGEAKGILNRGARTFLQKPFRFDDFSRIIREVLEAP